MDKEKEWKEKLATDVQMDAYYALLRRAFIIYFEGLRGR